MRKLKSVLSTLLVAALLLNLLPSAAVVASDISVGISGVNGASTVSNAVYGSTGGATVLNAVYGSGTQVTDNIITKVVMKDKDGNDLQSIRADQGSRVQIDLDWELPSNHSYKDGDYFIFQLPDKFKVDRLLTGNLDGGVGTYEVTPDGFVTFTFNDQIENSGWVGYFFVWREFEESKFSGGTKQDILFEFEGDKVTVPVHFKSKSSEEIDKKGTTDKGMNASEINWVVDVNLAELDIKDAVFKDVLPNGLDVQMSSIEVYELEVQLNGTVIEGPAHASYIPQQNSDGFQLDLGDIDQAYRVKYKTHITDKTDKSYRNAAELSGTNLSNPLTDSASVNVKFSKPLDKSPKGYVSATQTITWGIQYNYNEQLITSGNAWIKDTFDTAHQELLTSSFQVYEMVIANDGTASRKTGIPLTQGVDYNVTPSATGFELHFSSNIQSAYEVTYQTKAKNRVHEDSYTVNNRVEMHTGEFKTTSQRISQSIFSKSRAGVNYANKTITWKISLNDDLHTMSNVVINDSYAGQGMTLLPSTLSITGLTKDVDYRVLPNPDYSSGFKIEFLQDVTTKHEITYTTKFNPAAVTVGRYTNGATLDWDVSGASQTTLSKSAELSPDGYTVNNGGKKGVYDARTKQITWTIDVNYNLHHIADAVIQDFYTGDQTFLANSLTVTELELTGGSDGVRTKGSPLVLDTDYTVTTKQSAGKDGFELKFLNDIDKAYRITYKTSLEGKTIASSYSNQATMFDESQPTKLLFNRKASVPIKFGEEYVIKTGVQGTGANMEYANWTVNVNPGQSFVESGAELTDTLSANQILLTDTFVLSQVNVAADGTLTKASVADAALYTLNVTGNSFTLTFNQAIDKAYILEYRSFINADDGEFISNNASFAGQSSGAVQDNQNVSNKVSFSGAGGGVTTGKGDLKVIKEDAVTYTPLEGAVFGLYDKTGTTLLMKLVSDQNGEVLFENLRYKEYMLKELIAPSGYIIDTDYRAGKLITFSATSNEFRVTNVKGDWDFKLLKVDQDDPTKVLEGAIFKLQKDTGTGYMDVPGWESITTDASGSIQLYNLLAGNYQLIEIEAPRGYKLDATPHPFTIDPYQTAAKTITVSNEIYVGSVELTKLDATNAASLSGAEFELRDASGNVLYSGLTTDQDGKLLVNNLKAGTYQFVETQAPTDYILSTTPLTFEIVQAGLIQVTFTNKPATGNVELIKIEKDSPDVKLEGAQFVILDANQEVLKDQSGTPIPALTTDVDGELHVQQLQPGTYYFMEVTAPEGYVLDSQLIEFEIVSNQETKLTFANARYVGGGESGQTPTNPGPEQPVGPQPSQPGEPAESTPSVPGQPTQPGTPIQPGQPGDQGSNEDPDQEDSEDVDSGEEAVPSPDPENHPTTGVDSGQAGSGSTPDEEAGDQHQNTGKPQDRNDVAGSTDANLQQQQSSGDVLPKTGEASRLWIQLSGLAFILMGAVLWMARRKQLKSN